MKSEAKSQAVVTEYPVIPWETPEDGPVQSDNDNLKLQQAQMISKIEPDGSENFGRSHGTIVMGR